MDNNAVAQKGESLIVKVKQVLLKKFSLKKSSNETNNASKKTLPPRKKAFSIFLYSIIAIGLLLILYYVITGKQADDDSTISYEVETPSPKISPQDEIEPLYVIFEESVAPLAGINKPIDVGISIQPDIQGTWMWVTDTELQFTPEVDWRLDTKYQVKFDKSVFSEDKKLSTYKLSFSTPKFELSILDAQLYINPARENAKRITLTVQGNFPFDSNSLNEVAKLYVKSTVDDEENYPKNKAIPFTLQYDPQTYRAYLSSELLPTPKEDVEVEFRIEGGVNSLLSSKPHNIEESSPITIYGIYNFIKIEEAKIQVIRDSSFVANQVLIIETKGKTTLEELTQNMSVALLPKNRPKSEPLWQEIVEDYNWESASEVIPAVEKLLQPISVASFPSETPVTSIFTYKLSVPEDRFLLIEIAKNTSFYGGYVLPDKYRYIVKAPQYPRELKVRGDGNILRLHGSKKLSLYSQGITQAYVTVAKVKRNQIHHLFTQTNAKLSSMSFGRNYWFDEENISDIFTERLTIPSSDPKETYFFSYDLGKLLNSGNSGIFYVTFSKYSNGSTRYDKAFVMITDIGMWVKQQANESFVVMTQSISTGRLLADAEIWIIEKNGDTSLRARTNSKGSAVIPSFTNSRIKPVAFMIKQGNDVAYMPFDDSSSYINYTSFPINGVYKDPDPSALQAYLFSDRKLYRPGETMNFGFMVKTNSWERLSQKLPLVVEIFDPNYSLVHEAQVRINSHGLGEFNYSSFEYSPTGEYSVYLYLIKDAKKKKREVLSTEYVSVKQFTPDRLTVSSGFTSVGNKFLSGSDKGWIKPSDARSYVIAKNLFGTYAVGNLVRAEFRIRPTNISFSKYPQFKFINTFEKEIIYQQDLEESSTYKFGDVEYQLPLTQFEPSTYTLIFNASVYEKNSGKHVTTASQVLVSPLDYMVGYHAETQLDYVYHNTTAKVSLVAIDQELARISVPNLTQELYKTEYATSLIKNPNGTYEYKSIKKEVLLSRDTFTLSNPTYSLSLNTSEVGDYAVNIVNDTGQLLLTFDYSVVGEGNINNSLNRNTELVLKLDKENYNPGDEIEVYIQAPYKGSGFITIENNRVHAVKWFSMNTNSSVQYITLPKSVEGNAYINVVLSKSVHSPRAFASPMSAGAIPFTIDLERKTHNISLTVPQKVRPGETISITYATDSNASIILYGVDKGILQLAGYKTPDPLSEFFPKEALAVTTAQNFSLVLPELPSNTTRSIYGGGASADELLARNLNPFKRKAEAPVVFWSGILKANPTAHTYQYKIPSYFNGAVEVFAVAVSNSKAGVSTKSVTVQDEFIIQPNIPLFIAPSDEVLVSANIANNYVNSSGSTIVKLSTSKHFSIVGDKQVTLNLKNGQEGVANFRIKALDSLGAGEITFTIQDGNLTRRRTTSISVRPSTSYFTFLKSGMSNKEKIEIPVNQTPQYDELYTRDFAVSRFPITLVKGLFSYLESYPYGCTEQIVSTAFPYLILNDFDDFKLDPKKTDEKIYHTISVLLSRQNSNGSFNMWGGMWKEVNIEYHMYATHFLIEAQRHHYEVPSHLLSNALDFINEYLEDNMGSANNYGERAYGIYLLTYNGTIATNLLNDLYDTLQKEEHWLYSRATPFIIASYKLLYLEDEAKKILQQISFNSLLSFNKDIWDQFLYSSQYMYLMIKHLPDSLNNLDDALAHIQEQIQAKRYNSYNSSFSILAIASLVAKNDSFTNLSSIVATEYLEGAPIGTLSLRGGSLLNETTYSKDSDKIVLKNTSQENTYFQIVEKGYAKNPEKSTSEGLSVYTELQKDKKDTTKFKVGDNANLHIEYRAKEDYIRNVAIIVKLPSLMEVSRSFDVEQLYKSSNRRFFNYIDIQEDRIIVYTGVPTQAVNLDIPLTVINAGQATFPSTYAKGMYDTSKYATTAPVSITVD